MSSDDIWSLVTSSSKLERDKGINQLELNLKDGGRDYDLINKFVSFNLIEATCWQTKLGVLLGSKVFVDAGRCDERLLEALGPSALALLSDDEVRIRQAAGDLLGSFCTKFGSGVFESAKVQVFQLILTNLERSDLADHKEIQEESMEGVVDENHRRARRFSEASEIFHETAGWRNLETSVRCLQSMVAGCGKSFAPYIDDAMMDLIYRSLRHTNRFVRESGFHTCATLVEAAADDVFGKFGLMFAQHLAQGLADNWSQVRLAASVATRPYLMLGQDGEIKESVMAILAPRLCLNRYYLAEGVRIHSQDTWMSVTKKVTGRKMVEKYIDQTVGYYIKCTEADNHAVREAACQCIAELAAKISRHILQPHVQILLDTLLVCFKDDSWPVRDMACVASGNFIKIFPESARNSAPLLLDHFFKNLQDPISSVRQGAAASLANMVRAYGKDQVWSEIFPRVVTGLMNIGEQPEECLRFNDFGATEFSVAKRLRDNDMTLHENQTMYSCGSLAPRMGRGGCSDAKFQKPSEPWEYADGCVYFVLEISAIQECKDDVGKTLLPLLVSACRFRQYTLHYIFFETVTKTLPVIANNLGKKVFKPHLEDFFEAMFYACENENPLTSTSGRRCLRDMANFLGPNIFRGRVEQYHPKYLSMLDSALDEQEDGPCHVGPGDHGAGSAPVSIDKSYAPALGGTPTGSPRH